MNRILVVGLALVCSACAAAAQIPDQFKNLQVLPKDIAKKDLVDKMRGFCTSLGVRCTHCHVGEEGKPLETYDFAADTKAPKQTARVMLQMVQAVNHDWVSKVVSDRQERMQVSCVTCHHGQPVPRTLQATLTGTLAANGLPATIQKYRDLREQYYGRDTFDFGEVSLNNMARGLMRDNRTADALAMLELNAEFYPKSAMVQVLTGEAQLQAGDKEKAAAAYRQALELDPKNETATKRLSELGAK